MVYGGRARVAQQMLCCTVVVLSRRRKLYVLRGASQMLRFTWCAVAWALVRYVLLRSRSSGTANVMFYCGRAPAASKMLWFMWCAIDLAPIKLYIHSE